MLLPSLASELTINPNRRISGFIGKGKGKYIFDTCKMQRIVRR